MERRRKEEESSKGTKKKQVNSNIKVSVDNSTKTKNSRYNNAESFFLEHYKDYSNTEMSKMYIREDGKDIPYNYFSRIKNQLNKYGQINSGIVNANSKEKADGMILSKHHKRIISDGYEEIQRYGIKRYSIMLEKEYGLSWDGIRKQIGLMRRYRVI